MESVEWQLSEVVDRVAFDALVKAELGYPLATRLRKEFVQTFASKIEPEVVSHEGGEDKGEE